MSIAEFLGGSCEESLDFRTIAVSRLHKGPVTRGPENRSNLVSRGRPPGVSCYRWGPKSLPGDQSFREEVGLVWTRVTVVEP